MNRIIREMRNALVDFLLYYDVIKSRKEISQGFSSVTPRLLKFINSNYSTDRVYVEFFIRGTVNVKLTVSHTKSCIKFDMSASEGGKIKRTYYINP